MIIENGDLNIQNEIEKLVANNKTYIDAVLQICETHNLDSEYVAKHLSKPIIEKIKQEGQQLNLLKKTAKLPL
jgi:hypothetical protein